MQAKPPSRIAVVGAGLLGAEHARTIERLPSLATLVAVVDSSPVALSRFLEDHRGLAGFGTIKEMLVAREIDAAIVTTPHSFHAAQILELVEAGVGVLVEKPVVISAAELRFVIAAQDRTRAVVVVGQTKRFAELFRHWRTRLGSGSDRLGPLRSAAIVSLQDIVGALEFGLGRWFADGAIAGGGAAISHGVHVLDAVRFLTGLDYVRVSAMARYDEPMTNGAESDLTATMELSNGAVATFHVSYRAIGPPQGESIVLLFESGGLTLTSDGGERLRLRRGRDHASGAAHPEEEPPVPVGDGPFGNELRHLVELLRGVSAEEICSPRDNFNTIATIEALMRSAREQRPVDVEAF